MIELAGTRRVDAVIHEATSHRMHTYILSKSGHQPRSRSLCVAGGA
jgi:hypothetical protein